MLSGGFKLVQDWGYFECIPHQGKKKKKNIASVTKLCSNGTYSPSFWGASQRALRLGVIPFFFVSF